MISDIPLSLASKAVAEQQPDLVCLWDPSGKILDINLVGLAWLELGNILQAQGLSFSTFIVSHHRTAFQELSAHAVAGTTRSLSLDLQSAKGKCFQLDLRASPVRDATGNVVAVLGVARAMLTDALIARNLKQSEARFRTFVDHSTDSLFVHSNQGQILEVNHRACESLGYTREELVGLTPFDIDPEVTEEFLTELRHRLETENAVSFDRMHRRKDGTLYPVEVRFRAYWVEGERYTIVTARDISERKKAELRIRQLNRVYAVLSDINQLIVRVRDPQAIVDGACRIAVQKGNFVAAWAGFLLPDGKSLRLLAHAAKEDRNPAIISIDLTNTPPSEDPFLAVLKSGQHQIYNALEQYPKIHARVSLPLSVVAQAVAIFPIVISNQATGVFCLYAAEPGFFDHEELRLLDELSQDLSYALEACQHEEERVSALTRLRESEELFRELTESIQDVFWVMNPENDRIVYVSPAYEKIWGRPTSSALEEHNAWLNTLHAEDRPRLITAAQSLRMGQNYDEEYRILRPDGQIRWIRDRAFLVQNPAGKIERIVGVARDVTQHRLISEQLRQSQKMEAIGQLAGGVAHDFNNIITGILMQAELTGIRKDLSPEVREGIDQIRSSAERAANLTRQLLLLSRRQIMQQREVDINEVVTNLMKLIQRIIGEDIRLQLKLARKPLYTRVDVGMLEQVILNLVVNARDAMPDGGKLQLETEERTFDEAFVRFHPDVNHGRHVCLNVSDTGVGIPPEVVPHIFEPFFTTKETGKGTGLGLATAFGIVTQHHGWIDVESQPGQGATFRVFLAAIDPPELVPAHLEPVPRPQGGSETLLLVEDEPSVLSLLQTLLERHGYRVLTAANGHQAMEVWEKYRSEIALLLTDVVMPLGLSGIDLARRLRQEHPLLKVVFMSGYSADLAGRELKEYPGQMFLAKPFPPSVLLSTLRQCLSAVVPGEGDPI